jgi:hypothetical protein
MGRMKTAESIGEIEIILELQILPNGKTALDTKITLIQELADDELPGGRVPCCVKCATNCF